MTEARDSVRRKTLRTFEILNATQLHAALDDRQLCLHDSLYVTEGVPVGGSSARTLSGDSYMRLVFLLKELQNKFRSLACGDTLLHLGPEIRCTKPGPLRRVQGWWLNQYSLPVLPVFPTSAQLNESVKWPAFSQRTHQTHQKTDAINYKNWRRFSDLDNVAASDPALSPSDGHSPSEQEICKI